MKTVLINISYLIEVEDELLLGTDKAQQFNKLVFEKLSKYNRRKIDATHVATWNRSSFSVLDSSRMNCDRCSKCGGWTTDREKPSFIESLSNGATVDDKLLCDECLPKDHRWAF